jgi:2-haloalkanoic acid dehalogenase type II
VKLSDFKVLTFDCYGTLIDWERGLLTALAPLRTRAKTQLKDDAVLEAFSRLESRQQALTPAMPYAELLTDVHGQLAAEWGVAADPQAASRFGASVGDWPAFPDTVEALRYLKQHFRLVILSNVDRASFHASNQRLGVAFDAIYTAQDIGAYKPDPRTFAYMLHRLAADGFQRADVLHVAQSLFHDHVPANAAGLASAWIDRRHAAPGWGATAPVAGSVRYDLRFTSLAELADAHQLGG